MSEFKVLNLDGKELKSITGASATAETVMLYLSMRQRARMFSNLRLIRSLLVRGGSKIDQDDYYRFWDSLQELGVGKVIRNRVNKPIRFMWHCSLTQVARAALDGRGKVQTTSQDEKRDLSKGLYAIGEARRVSDYVLKAMTTKSESNPTVSPISVITGSKAVYIPIRDSYNVEIKVPADVSKKELDVISKALNCLLN